jgi:hypothetical protein
VERVEEINLNDACNPQNVTEERLVYIPFDTAVKGSADDISSVAGLQEQISISKKYETLRYNFQKQFLYVFWVEVK